MLFELELSEEPAPNPLGLELAFCGAERLDEYEALRPGERAVAEARLAEGQRWVGAWLDGALVSARWVADGRPAIDYLGLRLPLGPGEVYIYDTYTDPGAAWRGDRPRAGCGCSSRCSPPRACARAVCTCLPENRAAWRSIEKGGFRPAGKAGWVGLGPWRRTFVRRAPSTAGRARRLLREEGVRSLVFGVLGGDGLPAARDRGARAGHWRGARFARARLAVPRAGRPRRVRAAASRDARRGGRRGSRAATAASAGGSTAGSSSVRWLATGAPQVDYLDLALPLAEGEIYHFDSYVDPAQRGRGIAPLSPAAALAGARSGGPAPHGAGDPAREPGGPRDAAKAGYRITGRIGYVRLGRRRRPFLRRRAL